MHIWKQHVPASKWRFPCVNNLPEDGYFFHGATAPNEPGSPQCRAFMITLGTVPLGEWSARRSDIYLTIHNSHEKQSSMPPPHPGGIRTCNRSKRAAADPCLRPRGHCNRPWRWLQIVEACRRIHYRIVKIVQCYCKTGIYWTEMNQNQMCRMSF